MGVGRGGGGVVLCYGGRPAIGVDGALAVLWVDGSATIGLRRGKSGKSVTEMVGGWWEGASVEGMSRWIGRWWVSGSAYVGRLYGESCVGYMYARRVR